LLVKLEVLSPSRFCIYNASECGIIIDIVITVRRIILIMKRIQILPIILLIVSLGVLVIMVLIKVVGTRQQAAALVKTQTAIAAAITDTPVPTNTVKPSATPHYTETPSLPSLTVTPFPTDTPKPGEIIEEGCNEALFMADITIPDKTQILADHKFVKTWRLLNAGTCAWTTRYSMYYVSGRQMSGPDRVNVFPVQVEPGQSIDISVTLRAPKVTGVIRGYWGLKDQYGNPFGMGPAADPFYVEIKVID